MKKLDRKSPNQSGLSLIELLLAVVVIGVIAGTGVIGLTSAISAAKEQKLEKDVVTLNAALTSFIANGGSLDGALTEAQIVERLKTAANAAQSDQLVGVRDAILDPRIKVEMQTAGQAATTKPRAVWDTTKNRFVIAHSGSAGIKRFIIDDSEAGATETTHERNLTVEYSKKGNDKWVWEYVESPTAGIAGPSNLPPGGSSTSVPGGYTPPGVLQLAPPEVSIPGDTYPIIDYDGLVVSLTNPNPIGVSELFYSVVPGVWERYFGPIPVDPGVDLQAQAVTIHPVVWSDSDPTLDEYRTEPVELELEVDFFGTSFDYATLGGALETGSAAVNPADPGEASVTNLSDIPTRFQNSATFQIYWTFDGSDPLTSATAIAGDDFADGFPGQQIPFGIDDWGASDTLDVKAVAKSLDPNIVTDSEVMEYPLTRSRTQLPPPLLTINNTAATVDLDLDVASGVIPAGARIYYVQDGSDPGIGSDGEPAGGTLHDGSSISPSSSATIVARTYAPVAYVDWFLPSEPVSGTISVVGNDELYVGGEFSAGTGMRNIARLAPDGSLDMGFNPGMGASAGSVVGALQGQGGAGVLAGGNFESVNGISRMGIARFKFDGSVDVAFDADLN